MVEPDADLDRGWRTAATRVIALLPMLLEFWPRSLQSVLDIGFLDRRLMLLVCLTTVLCLNDGHLPALGFRLSPIEGWGYWFRLGLRFLLVIAVLCVMCGLIWWLCEWTIPVVKSPPSIHVLFHFCVDAPFYEELIFRSLLFVAVVPTIGGRGAIIVSGVLFAAIHVLRGNPGPDNQIAGFMLAWAFLKSRTILVPIAMHSAGNFIAVSLHVACWYFA